MMDCWHELGIEPTDDVRSVKRAYAKRLKKTRPTDDPEGFQRLRQAYEIAREEAQYYSDDGGYETWDDPFGEESPLESADPGSEEVRFDGMAGELELPEELARPLRPAPEERRGGSVDLTFSHELTRPIDPAPHGASLLVPDEPDLDAADVQDLVDEVISAPDPIAAFEEARRSPALVPLRPAQLFEEQLADAFGYGRLDPYDRAELFGALAAAYEWDDVRSPLLERHPHLVEPAEQLAGARRAHRWLEAVVEGNVDVKSSHRRGAEIMLSLRPVKFGEPRHVLALMPTLRERFGSHWSWLLPRDMTTYEMREDTVAQRVEKRGKSFPCAAWAVGFLLGLAPLLIAAWIVRWCFYAFWIWWGRRRV